MGQEDAMKQTIVLKSDEHSKVFDRALFEFLSGQCGREDAPSVFVMSQDTGAGQIRVIECMSVRTIDMLRAYIDRALHRLETNGRIA
jgi:hypothetical protein